MKISASAAQDIALTQQAGNIAGHLPQPQRMPFEQQVGDSRVRRHFSHRLAMGTQTTVRLQGAQPVQQVTRLGKGCRGR
ncbi:hypothetical protein D3C81_1971140 [compost metagenome]